MIRHKILFEDNGKSAPHLEYTTLHNISYGVTPLVVYQLENFEI